MVSELLVLSYIDENGEKHRCCSINKCDNPKTPYAWFARKFDDPETEWCGCAKTLEDALALLWKGAIRNDLIVAGKVKVIVEEGEYKCF